jgi:hypothetical protein
MKRRSFRMRKTDDFSSYISKFLDGSYDCVDRVSIRGCFPLGLTSGGMVTWWERLHPGVEISEQALRAMAADFGRRVQAYARQNAIPLERCEPGDREKHVRVEKARPKDPAFTGVFRIMVTRAPGLVWRVWRGKSGRPVVRRPKNWPLINHYHFHLVDREWGHVAMRMSGHPPFGLQINVNGHEWVQRQAAQQGVTTVKAQNCFVGGSQMEALSALAAQLDGDNGLAHLATLIDRWVYSACLCFGLALEEQKRSGFVYRYSCAQIEYSRNLLFKSGRRLDQIYQGLIERTRLLLDVPRLKTIFGRKNRPHYKRKGGGRLEKVIERSTYDLTVFKLHFGKLTLKMYDKGDRVLRIEVVVANTTELRCGKLLERLPGMLAKLEEMAVRFLAVVQAAHTSFLDAGLIEHLSRPSRRGTQRVAGVNLEKRRMRAVSEGVLALAAAPRGFTALELSRRIRQQQGRKLRAYTSRKAAYDLRKLRGKALVERIGKTRRYQLRRPGIRTLAGLYILHEKVIKPVLTGACRPKRGRPPKSIAPLDIHYTRLQKEMLATFQSLHLAA